MQRCNQQVALIQHSSAASERGFSLIKNSFCNIQARVMEEKYKVFM
jgi:hypothetical protein